MVLKHLEIAYEYFKNIYFRIDKIWFETSIFRDIMFEDIILQNSTKKILIVTFRIHQKFDKLQI